MYLQLVFFTSALNTPKNSRIKMQPIEPHSIRLRLFVWPKTDPRKEVKPSLLESNDDESNKLEEETEGRRGEGGYGRLETPEAHFPVPCWTRWCHYTFSWRNSQKERVREKKEENFSEQLRGEGREVGHEKIGSNFFFPPVRSLKKQYSRSNTVDYNYAVRTSNNCTPLLGYSIWINVVVI